MTYHVGDLIGGNKYRVEVRQNGYNSELVGIYDGYYDFRSNTFSLYLRSASMTMPMREIPGKIKVSAYETSKIPKVTLAKPKEIKKIKHRCSPKDIDGQLKIC